MKTNSPLKNELTETMIIERILDGETELFEILMQRYNELLFRTIRSYLYVETDIEDCMQDTYTKAFEKLFQFKKESMFSTWLIRIGINEALQRKRKSTKNRIIPLHQDHDILQIEDHTIMNPERRIMYKESTYFMEKAIDTLPEKYKIVYVLKEVENLSVSEIAKILDISKSNVKVRLFRSRKMIKDSILNTTNHANIFEFGNSKCDSIVHNVMKHIIQTKTHFYLKNLLL